MAVKRVVANVAAEDISAGHLFYRDLLGLDVLMDLGWVVTYGSTEQMTVQLSVAVDGGGGAPVPDLSIEVDNLCDVYAAALQAGVEVVYPLTEEPWGVRRFYVRDPFGRVVNILEHSADSI